MIIVIKQLIAAKYKRTQYHHDASIQKPRNRVIITITCKVGYPSLLSVALSVIFNGGVGCGQFLETYIEWLSEHKKTGA